MTAAPRSLVLITVDCFRADHAGFLGYSRPTTPFLDSVAEQSFVFRNAIATGTPTYYSLPALLASRYPLALGRDVIGIAPEESTLASQLRDFGFETAAFIAANPYISEAAGYDNGFDVFCDFSSTHKDQPVHANDNGSSSFKNGANRVISRFCHRLPLLGAAYDELYFQYCHNRDKANSHSLNSLRRFPSADVIVDAALAWLNQISGRSFFLWLHLMDPHAPYYPRPEALRAMGSEIGAEEAHYLNAFWMRKDVSAARLQKKAGAIQELYDAGIRWADEQIGRLVQHLAELQLWNECILAVTADHGEEFLEHGGRFHAPFHLSDELIRVPLVVRAPGFQGRHDIPQPFGLIDLAPTLLDALGLPAPVDFRGSSYWRKIASNQPIEKTVFTECVFRCTNPLEQQQRKAPRLLAVRAGDYKLVMNFSDRTEQLFDLRSDPEERTPLPPGKAAETRRFLLQCAKQHIAESRESRNGELRLAAQVRDLRAAWASAGSAAN